MELQDSKLKNIFLTDDDSDDCLLFSEAIHEIYPKQILLTIANDGVELLQSLEKNMPPAPDVIFLDLNMPRKNGFECLDEIRNDPKLKAIPIVIFSTSSNLDIVKRTYQKGANYYICKPQSFKMLKKSIQTVLSFEQEKLCQQPHIEAFVIKISETE